MRLSEEMKEKTKPIDIEKIKDQFGEVTKAASELCYTRDMIYKWSYHGMSRLAVQRCERKGFDPRDWL